VSTRACSTAYSHRWPAPHRPLSMAASRDSVTAVLAAPGLATRADPGLGLRFPGYPTGAGLADRGSSGPRGTVAASAGAAGLAASPGNPVSAIRASSSGASADGRSMAPIVSPSLPELCSPAPAVPPPPDGSLNVNCAGLANVRRPAAVLLSSGAGPAVSAGDLALSAVAR